MSGTATITDLMGVALGELLRNATVHLAVGAGLAEWDALTTPPQPDRTRTQLYNELARVVASVGYLTPAGNASASPTNRLECTGIYAIGVANGTIREMGLFVGGSAVANSGRLVAVVNFAAIAKPAGGSDYSLTRIMRPVLLAR